MIRKQLTRSSALLLLIVAWPLHAQDAPDAAPPTALSLDYFAPMAGVWKSTDMENGEQRITYTLIHLREEINAVDIVQLSTDPETKIVKGVMRGFMGVPGGTGQIQAVYFGSDGFQAEAVGAATDEGVILKAAGARPDGHRVSANFEYVFGEGNTMIIRVGDTISPMGYGSEGRGIEAKKTDFGGFLGLVREGVVIFSSDEQPEPPGIFGVTRPLGGRWRVVDQAGNTQLNLNWSLRVMNRWVLENWGGPEGQSGINITGVDPVTRQLVLWSVNAQTIGRSGYWEVLDDGVIAQVEGRGRLVRTFSSTDDGEEQFHARWQQMQQGRFVDTDDHYVAVRVKEEEPSASANGSWQDQEWATLIGVWRAQQPTGAYRIKRITKGQEVLEVYDNEGKLISTGTTDMTLERHGGINFFTVRSGTPRQYTSIYKVHDGKWYEQLTGIFANGQGPPNAFIIYDRVE